MSDSFMQEPTAPLPPVPPAGRLSSWPSSLRRHRWFALIGAIVVVAVLVGGALWALVGTGGSGAPAAAASASPSAGRRGTGKGARGSVVSESGSTWTLRERSGRTVTVLVTPQTAFGTKKAPVSAAEIPVGTTVVVTGALSGNSITATRISVAAKPSATPSTSTSPATNGG